MSLININISQFQEKTWIQGGMMNIPKEVEKAYVEGIYADTPANRKLGRVGMSYAQWAKIQSDIQAKKEKEGIERGDEKYVNLSPLEKELKDLEPHHTKTIHFENGYKILCRLDTYYHKYIGLVFSEKGNNTKQIVATDKKTFAREINKFCYEKHTKVGKPKQSFKPAFTRPTERTLTDSEQENIDVYWRNNRSNPVLGNLLSGSGTSIYRTGWSEKHPSESTKWINDNVPYASDGYNFFDDRERFYKNFEDMSMDELNKGIKTATPKDLDPDDQEKFQDNLFWGNILRAHSDTDIFETKYSDLYNRYLNPSATGKKYLLQITPTIKKEKGTIKGIHLEVSILDRRNFSYRKVGETQKTDIEGKTLKELSDKYFDQVSSLLQQGNSNQRLRVKPDTVFFSSDTNNIFAGQNKFFFENYNPEYYANGQKREKKS